MLRTCCLVVALATATSLSAMQQQSPNWSLHFDDNGRLPAGFRQFHAKREDGSELIMYLGDFNQGLRTRKPLLLYVEGSGAQSHFVDLGDGRYGYTTFGLIAKNFGDRFHIATAEKRGVAFGDNSHRGIGQGASDEYNLHATLEDRVADIRLLIDQLADEANIDKSKIVLLGHSEGADVAAAVAAADDRVTHVAFLSGGGACQLYDWFVQRRRALASSGASSEEVETAISQLEQRVRDVIDNPKDDRRFIEGHSYRRWASFATIPAAENLLKTRAKLFVAQGTEDQAVPIESFDYLTVELLRHGRTDAVIRRYPRRDHSFIKTGDEPSNEPFQEVVGDVVKWAWSDTTENAR